MLSPQEAAAWQTAYNISYYVLLVALFISFAATGLTFIANNRLSGDLTERLTQTTATAGEARERAAALEKEAAEARQKTVELQKALEEERIARQPRSLSNEQVRKIVSSLRNCPRDQIIVKPNIFDTEADQYAAQFIEAFQQAGIPAADQPLPDIVSINKPGIHVAATDPSKHDEQLICVLNAFEAAKVDFSVYNYAHMPDGRRVLIVIGRKE